MKRMQQAGFTLMELMIVVMIIGILAVIAYPRYQDYVIRSNRTEAMALLNEVAARQERYFAQNNTYADTPEKLNITAFVNNQRFYTLAIDDVSTSTYLLTAHNERAPQTNDALCADLTLDQAGVKGTSGTSTAAECWK